MNRAAILKHEFVEYIPAHLVDGTIYVSMTYAVAQHRCCCGCGNKVITPFSPTDWKLIFDGESISIAKLYLVCPLYVPTLLNSEPRYLDGRDDQPLSRQTQPRVENQQSAGRTITFIMCRCGWRDIASQVARCLPDQDIMRRYRMTVLPDILFPTSRSKGGFRL